MSGSGGHAFALAIIFLATALVLRVYHKRNPDNRPELLKLGGSRCAMCGAAFVVSGVSKTMDFESYRLQVITLAPVNLAVILTIAALCTIQARSYGTVDISSGARQLLRHGKRIFILTFGASMAVSLCWPVAAQADFQPARPIFLLDRALVTFPEMFFVAVAAFVSFQAASSQEPVGRIRIQQASIFLSQVFIVMIIAITFFIVCCRVFVEDDTRRRALIEAGHVWENALLVIIAVTYVLGVCLYYVNDERTRLITRFNRWRRMRESLDRRLRRLDDKSLGQQYPQYTNIKGAMSELVKRSLEEEKDSAFDRDAVRKSQLTFKVLTVVASPTSGVNKHEDAELLTLVKYHEGLLREPCTREISWKILANSGEEVVFDLKIDPLPKIIKQVRDLLLNPRRLQLVNQPQWFQLAVVAAAEAGLLPEDKSAKIAGGEAVMERVSRAYYNADIQKTLYGTPTSVGDGRGIDVAKPNLYNI